MLPFGKAAAAAAPGRVAQPATSVPALGIDRAPVRLRGKPLRAPRPNAGTEALYRRKILNLVDQMQASVMHWLPSAYRRNEPEVSQIAQDALPARELNRAVGDLRKQWESNFAKASRKLAWWFSQDVEKRSTAQLKTILRQGGFSVQFRVTPAVTDILQATVQANVALIKSIPEQYFTQIEGMVMRSVQTGRDLAQLEADLRHSFGVTRRRAALIARDQNNKATSAIQKARQLEAGLSEGIWMHSHGGREPRPTHLANHGKRFNIAEGWYDPDPRVRRRIMPGELINCHCVWRPVVKGFD